MDKNPGGRGNTKSRFVLQNSDPFATLHNLVKSRISESQEHRTGDKVGNVSVLLATSLKRNYMFVSELIGNLRPETMA